jgi:hypothetical protein
MNEWNPKMGGILQQRACPLEIPTAHRLRIRKVAGTVCFYREVKEKG